METWAVRRTLKGVEKVAYDGGFWGLALAPPLPSYYAVLRATKASEKKPQKIAPAFKELIAQRGRPDTTEFSSKLDGHEPQSSVEA